MFPDSAAAEAWFEEQRWPNGERTCPDCGSDSYSVTKSRKPMPYRCRKCRNYFSVKKGTVMQGVSAWLPEVGAGHLPGRDEPEGRQLNEASPGHQGDPADRLVPCAADQEGVPSSCLHRDGRPVEVDEGYFGGLEKNRHARQAGSISAAGLSARPLWSLRRIARREPSTPGHRGDGRGHASAVRGGAHHAGGRGVYRRAWCLRWDTRCPPSGGQALRRRVRGRAGAHERRRELLGAVEARLPRHLPPDQRQAPTAVRR